ncbi:MAG: CPBP family intramembrane metalloprotease [Candidatus Diapherotrites archaeon]|uniref:CPBP family intramembrane metalloprotease n=1 Tax=Candidatus Iainarchaeum sp. TaxID=3101447 RepID=A0A8T4KW03_9ARCH|nr:MAG: hypothetical protein QT12_C0020G0011 [archaeon GW2011_AR21]MBS3058327.1 CPBP family intramembrane metalloprotease [Candidatus Diapherotrites archaeon]
MIFNILLELAFLLIPLYYFKKHRKSIAKETGLERKKASQAWKYSLIILGAMGITALALGIAFSIAGFNDSEKVSEALQEAIQEPLFLAFTLTVGVALEEFFFRGFLVKRWGILASSAVFGIMHIFYGSVAEIAGAFFLGLVLAFFWKKYQNLYANIYAHLLWNAVALITATMV